MLRRINKEATVVEARLQKVAVRLGVRNRGARETVFTSRDIDSPKADLL